MFFSHFGKNLYDFSVQIATSHVCRSTAGWFAFVTTCYFLSRLRYPDVIIFILIFVFIFYWVPCVLPHCRCYFVVWASFFSRATNAVSWLAMMSGLSKIPYSHVCSRFQKIESTNEKACHKNVISSVGITRQGYCVSQWDLSLIAKCVLFWPQFFAVLHAMILTV